MTVTVGALPTGEHSEGIPGVAAQVVGALEPDGGQEQQRQQQRRAAVEILVVPPVVVGRQICR